MTIKRRASLWRNAKRDNGRWEKEMQTRERERGGGRLKMRKAKNIDKKCIKWYRIWIMKNGTTKASTIDFYFISKWCVCICMCEHEVNVRKYILQSKINMLLLSHSHSWIHIHKAQPYSKIHKSRMCFSRSIPAIFFPKNSIFCVWACIVCHLGIVHGKLFRCSHFLIYHHNINGIMLDKTISYKI